MGKSKPPSPKTPKAKKGWVIGERAIGLALGVGDQMARHWRRHGLPADSFEKVEGSNQWRYHVERVTEWVGLQKKDTGRSPEDVELSREGRRQSNRLKKLDADRKERIERREAERMIPVKDFVPPTVGMITSMRSRALTADEVVERIMPERTEEEKEIKRKVRDAIRSFLESVFNSSRDEFLRLVKH